MAQEDLSGTTLEGYSLTERIGEGGTATVYRAEHPSHGTCAVKVLRERLRSDQTAVKRFLREAGYGSRVEHPGVVRTYDYGSADGVYYLALEWAVGESLAEHVARRGPLPPQLTASIVNQLSDALAAAHAAAIIHRDLKPENIMFDPSEEHVKLLDFGIARDAEQAASDRLTRAGFFVGTLQYVAPETLSGELVGESADIYSVATITYYLLTGEHPYTGRNPRVLFQQLLQESPRPLSQAVHDREFHPAVEAAVMRSLERDPAARHSSVKAFAEDFAQAVSQGGTDPVEKGVWGGIRGLFRRGT
jgi:serine/threonine-protein kinase